MSSDLNQNWKPEFGTIYTWYGVDKNGIIGVFVNNCWGGLPKCLLRVDNAEELLDSISEYLYEESEVFLPISPDKNGDYTVDMFPAWRGQKTKEKVKQYHDEIFINNRLSSEANFAKNKGVFIYYAVEGSYPGNDYPVGYEGDTEMGDYYRYLVPTIYGGIEDFPQELRKGFAIADSLDFTVDRLIANKDINEHFERMFGE